MSVTKDLIILALTKMHGGVCTAGIDADGNWVRPVRARLENKGHCDTITDYCLLPLDFFHGGKSHLVNLGLTRFSFSSHTPQPPHVEDWTLDLRQKPTLLRKLSHEEQEKALAAHVEHDLSPLLERHERSLMLIQPEEFSVSFSQNHTGDDVSVRASFTFNGKQVNDIGCTDLRMRALGRKRLEKSGGVKCSLTNEDFVRHGKQTIYFAVGLSRLFQNRHWLILVGVHSIPEVEAEIDYSKL